MKLARKIVFPFLLGAFVLLPNHISARAKKAVVSPVVMIDADYRAGLIDLDTKALLEVQSIKSPETLPAKYRQGIQPGDRFVGRDATTILLQIKRDWNLLSKETQAALSSAIARLPADFSMVSTGGSFRLHYNDTGSNAVSMVDLDGNFKPDFVERCASYLDSAYEKHVLLGYILPPSDDTAGGDNLYDIYFENTGYYGYTVNESSGPQPWTDAISFIVLNNDFVGFPPNNDPEGQVAGAAKVTAAHEYHHAVQFAYDVTEPQWFLESDATHMEDIVFNNTDDNYNYLSLFFDAPQTSLTENTSHAYSCFVWEMFLVEKFDTSLIRAFWEGARYDPIFNVMADSLSGRYGWSVDSVFGEFAQWNICTANRDDGLHYSEGSNYPPALIGRSHSIYPVALQNSPTAPAGYGTSYVSLYPGTAAGTLHLTFNGNDARDWSAWVMKSVNDNSHTFEQITLDPVSKFGTIDIPNFEDYYRVILIGANISEFSTASAFTYSASVSVPYGVSAQSLTTDSSVYSGGQRYFDIEATNNAPVNDILSLTSWDDSGWVALDTTNKALAPGSSYVFKINVQPPQATPLASSESIKYKVWSWGDTTKNVIDSTGAKTVLQRGDIDFSGTIDISDLTYFVDFLFVGGDRPQPIDESGDFDCTTSISITDLTSFVAYLFDGGPVAPCNPY